MLTLHFLNTVVVGVRPWSEIVDRGAKVDVPKVIELRCNGKLSLLDSGHQVRGTIGLGLQSS